MRAALAAALILLLAACGADNAATSSPESSIADEVSDITLSPQAMRNAVLTAVNMTGLLSVDDDDWIELTTDGCRRGAWDWATAETMAQEFQNAHPDLGSYDVAALDHVLWILVAQSCNDLVPPDALEEGPPPGEPELLLRRHPMMR